LEVGPQANATQEASAKLPEHPANASLAPVEGPATKEEPVYEVIMPPLIYDARAKEQPEVDPTMIVLVRRVRVRPTLIFQGRVEGEMAASTTPVGTTASSARGKSSEGCGGAQ
jgi:hypothetical protein